VTALPLAVAKSDEDTVLISVLSVAVFIGVAAAVSFPSSSGYVFDSFLLVTVITILWYYGAKLEKMQRRLTEMESKLTKEQSKSSTSS
jgi:hypothetical protein